VFHALYPDEVDSEVEGVYIGTGDLTEARAASMYLPDADGLYAEFDGTEPGIDGGRVTGAVGSRVVYADTVGGDPLTEMPWFVGAPAATNLALNSNLYTSWTAYSASSVGMDGGASTGTELIDDSAVAPIFTSKNTTISTDALDYVVRVFFRKQASTTTLVRYSIGPFGGTRAIGWLDVSTGDITVATGPTPIVNLVGLYYELVVVVTNNVGAVTFQVSIYPAFATKPTTTQDNSATGTINIGNVEVYLGSSATPIIGSPPIFTTGASVSRDACALSFDDANHSDTSGAYYLEVNLS
jgi:hypothetical protein